jgi:hypothetical protein
VDIVGIALLLIALGLTAWWVTKDKPYKSWALAMCLVAVTISLILLLPGRAIELTLKSVGTIKAAAQQASADANVISDLRNRIERQSAAIDSVAQQANTSLKLEEQLSDKAASAVKKIDDLNKTLTVANNQMLSGIKSLAGTDSFAYVIPQPTDKDGNVPLAIRSVGKNILTGVKLTIHDLADYPFGEPQVIDVGVMAADTIRLLEGVYLKAPTKPGDHGYSIEISAQNGIFDEGVWLRTQIVNKLGCVSDSLRVSKRRTVLESNKKPTPREIRTLMLIDQGWHSYSPCTTAK